MKKHILLLSLILPLLTMAQSNTKMCRLKVDKVTKSASQGKTYQIGSKTLFRHSSNEGSKNEGQFLLMMEGYSSSMTIDDSTIFLKCRILGNNQYEVDINLNSENSGISTRVLISGGQKTNLGGIVHELKDKDKSIDINQGASYEKKTGNKNIEYYLSAQ